MAPKKNAAGGRKGKGTAPEALKATEEKKLSMKNAAADEVGTQTQTGNIVSFVCMLILNWNIN